MPALVLSEEEQVALRAVIACEPVPEIALHHEGPLRHLARLIASDAMGIALLDATGRAVGEMALHGRRASGDAPHWDDESAAVGIRQRNRGPALNGSARRGGVAVLSLGVRREPGHVVKLWLIRRKTDFTHRVNGRCSASWLPRWSACCASGRGRSCPVVDRPGAAGAAPSGHGPVERGDRRPALRHVGHRAQAPRECLPQARGLERLAAVTALEGGQHPAADRSDGGDTVD